MRIVSALVFCLICVGHAHELWANGSTHHNNTGDVTVDNDIDVSNRTDVENSNRTDVDVNNRAEGGDAYAVGKGGNASSNSGSYSGSEANVNIKGDDVEAAAASANVYLSGCQQGAAAQGLGLGASLGGESRVCQLLRLAAAHQALGQPYEAMVLVRQATLELNGGGATPNESTPAFKVSRWLRFNVVAAFGWLPFVGHAL